MVRGNASEIIAVAGLGGGGRGVDATAGVEDAAAAATALAERTGGVVAVSGPVDLVVGDGRSVRIANGDPLLTKVTGGGCALGAVMAAYAALDDDRLASTAAAVAYYTVAAELAAERSAGPGSFAVAFLDALATVTPADGGGAGAVRCRLTCRSIWSPTDRRPRRPDTTWPIWSRPRWRAG